MKKNTILNRILFPMITALLLLPILSCLIFYVYARKYTYQSSSNELKELRDRIVPIMEESFYSSNAYGYAAGASSDNNNVRDPVKLFLGKAGPLASQTGGNAQLMVLAGNQQLIYPRDEQIRSTLSSLATIFSVHLADGTLTPDHISTLKTNSNETYLITVYEVPFKSERLKYIIIYCATSHMDAWLSNATLIVLLISIGFSILIVIILRKLAGGITKPIHRLCYESEKIGEGIFTQIEPPFAITELENLRNSMNSMSLRLKEADINQKNFFQNVSHELRNPLMSISGYAQGIEKGVFESIPDAAHTILEESIRLTNVVNSLLTLSRIEASEHIYHITPLKLIETIEDCMDNVNGLALQRNISLTVDPFNNNLQVYGNEELLYKILENLLTNAIRYSVSSVNISVLQDTENVLIYVKDDGCGISPDDLPHIFERCYKGKGGNFGIGLAIAQSAAEKMNGSITAANCSTCGAVFTLKLKKVNQ